MISVIVNSMMKILHGALVMRYFGIFFGLLVMHYWLINTFMIKENYYIWDDYVSEFFGGELANKGLLGSDKINKLELLW